MTTLETYEIPAENMSGLLAKLATLSKRSQRIQGKAIDLNIVEEVRTPRVNQAGKPVVDMDGNPVFAISYKVTIETEVFRIEGWTFVATIDHSATTGNLLRVVPNITYEIPEKYRTVKPHCDHCGTIRSRRDTFLLRCEATGEFKQIGRQCVAQFIGQDAEAMVARAEVAAHATPSNSDADYDGDLMGGMRDRRYIYVRTFLAHTAAVIRKHGWVGRKQVEITGGMSTSDDAHQNMFRKRGSGRPPFVPVELTDKDLAVADAALTWAQGLNSQKEYEYNLMVLANETCIEGRSIGLLASMVRSYQLHTERSFERAQRNTAMKLTDSQHIGVIGAKIGTTKKDVLAPMDAVLYGFHSFAGFYGPTYIYRFLSADGNVLVWKVGGDTQGAEALDLGSADAAQRVSVRIVGGRVKQHTEYEGVKQTVLTRCKIEKIAAT